MSTKSTLKYGTDWSLYEDMKDEDYRGENSHVHLQILLSRPSEFFVQGFGNSVRLTVRLTQVQAREMGLIQ